LSSPLHGRQSQSRSLLTIPRSLFCATTTYLEYSPFLATPNGFGQTRSLGACLETCCLPLAASLSTVCERSSCSKKFHRSEFQHTTTQHCACRAIHILRRFYGA
jgi:hypothetical protein